MSIGASSVEITGLLKAWGSGDQAALARLAERVYPELHLMARRYMKNERQGDTLHGAAVERNSQGGVGQASRSGKAPDRPASQLGQLIEIRSD